eukprot:3457197-Rhodomonas_salina.1
MPCSLQNVLILPQTTSHGTDTVTGVTSLITGLHQAPSAPQAHGVCNCQNTEVEDASVQSESSLTSEIHQELGKLGVHSWTQ